MHNGQKNIKSAEIVTIGTEILLGDLVDTNTAWLSARLAIPPSGTIGTGSLRPSRRRLRVRIS